MKKRYLIGGALVALMAIGAVGASIEEKQLAELRKTDFDSYLAQIRQQDEALQLTDARVGKIWKVIQQRQKVLAEDWLIIVTTDHGRTRQTGKDHGGHSQRERTTWISTNSRHLNGRFSQTPGIVDILPSIVNHLDLQVPELIRSQLDGQAFIDRF